MEITTSATKFERKMRQCLTGSERTFLFDQGWVREHGGASRRTIARLSQLSDFTLYELSGSNLTVEKLVGELVKSSAESVGEVSNFRILINAMEKQRQGLIVIHKATKLGANTVHLLGRLITFVQRRKLRWKFVFIADCSQLDEIMSAQLDIDRRYPAQEPPSSLPWARKEGRQIGGLSRWIGGLFRGQN